MGEKGECGPCRRCLHCHQHTELVASSAQRSMAGDHLIYEPKTRKLSFGLECLHCIIAKRNGYAHYRKELW